MTTLAAVVLVAVLIIFAVLGRNQPLTGEFQKPLLIIVIIFSAILLITAGYSDAQIAPAFSLLGAIVGYLFGRTDWRADRFTTDPEVAVEEKQNGQAASGVGQTNRVAATNTGVSPPETKNRTTFPM
ncbi:hypothetical protein [Agrobacterium vitis]|uniref:Uncharacterized protein n=1 Tax=Agrobacterium vitis TaxID=373 RepID=A0A7K1RNF4_AGRVI|nr:hypothetical protein [Agrobacterium vitis]MVA59570.1 hypothetical protein [Agrobacterium vitis]